MRRTPIVTLLLLVVLTVVFAFGIGGGRRGAATVTRYQQNASQLTLHRHLVRRLGHRGQRGQLPLRERVRAWR